MRIAMATLFLAGCTLATDLHGQDCQTDLDCSAGRVCSANNLCLLTSKAPECVHTDQCQAGALCADGKCEDEEEARWGCVGHTPEKPIRGANKVTLQLKLATRARSGTVAPSAASAVACALPTCEEMEGPFASDDTGVVKVVVDQGFEGFIKLTSDGLIDTLYQLQAPLNADQSAAAEVTMLSASDVSKIAQAAGAKVDWNERAVVLFQLLDCQADLSGDVSVAEVAEDSEVDIVYLALNQTADPAAGATSDAGVAMALDVSVGSPEFKLTRPSSSTNLGSIAVATVAGAITYVPYQFGR